MIEVVALSGGKDSTAMALRLAELEPDVERIFFCTPTGDELPEMTAHWGRLEVLLEQSIVSVTTRTLLDICEEYDALPNWRQRWCTRMLKIEPCLAFLGALDARGEETRLAVGLRADEPERRGIYSESVTNRFPLREWGWGLDEVVAYNRARGVKIPQRTDCARCYGQRLSEWWELWKSHPEVYADAEEQERRVGHTFRSPARDTWPASLEELRALFEVGRTPRGARIQLPLFEDEDTADVGCRVCRL